MTLRASRRSPRVRRPLPVWVWVVAGIVVVGLILLANRYGFHRDELYFIAAGRRPAWGYVDQPGLTPLLARLGDLLPGTVSPLAIRILPALSAGTVVIMSAFLARRFGGGRRAMIFSAVFTAGGGFFLAVGHLLSTATFDVLIWTVTILVVAMLLDGADPRWWLAVGALVGLGFNNKHTIVALAVALLVGILATPQRSTLTGIWPWVGAAAALGLAAPNLFWQAANGWPQLEMAQSLRESSAGLTDYLLLQVATLSAFMVVPAAAGFRRLWADASGRRWRAFPIAFALLFVVFAVTGGKGYYVSPLYVPLFAAGALWVDGLGSRGKIAVLSLVALGIGVTLFLSLPLLNPEEIDIPNEVNKELGETYGWRQLVDEIERVYLSLPDSEQAKTVIFTSNYGQAGAVEVLGGDRLPQPVSGHNNYWIWGPPSEVHGPIIAVGDVGETLESYCPDLEQAAVFRNAANVDNDEQGTRIWLCRRARIPLSSVWDQVRHYN